MPSVYMNPGPNAGALNGEGKTTCQVPVGSETVFFNKEGAKYRDIRDGTSHTILLVEVEPGRAVVWTKPEDWEADLNNPREGLAGAERDSFMAAFADGHVEIIDLRKTPDARLRALLTRAGREPGESD
jgi:prepilin-type processing-associated H-X9-DG protein